MGYPGIELVENGANVNVDMENVQKYIDQVLDVSLGRGVRSQVEAFQVGFSQVFSYTTLKAFTPDELVMLFGRVEEDWSIETLMDSVKADHGFNMDSKSVKNLLQTSRNSNHLSDETSCNLSPEAQNFQSADSRVLHQCSPSCANRVSHRTPRMTTCRV